MDHGFLPAEDKFELPTLQQRAEPDIRRPLFTEVSCGIARRGGSSDVEMAVSPREKEWDGRGISSQRSDGGEGAASIERTRSYDPTHGKELVDAIAVAKDPDADGCADGATASPARRRLLVRIWHCWCLQRAAPMKRFSELLSG